MSDKKIRTMVTAAVLAALSCVATMVVQIPSPMNGYVNLGDCFVLLSGWLLGPWWGAAAGGIGSMLADLLLGYGHYAPGTLIIKGAMALVAALVFKAFKKNTAGALVGGLTLDEPAADLAAVVAIASSYLDKPVPSTMAAIGEVGLSGEIRSITHMEQRLSEVKRLGFTQCMVPAHKVKDLKAPVGLELLPVANISRALQLLARGQ